MIVLHVGDCDGTPHLWGEHIKNNTHAQATHQTMQRSFGASIPDIYKSLRGTKLTIRSNDATVNAWLPTDKYGPIPSTSTPDIDADTTVKMVPWEVPAMPLPIKETIDILCISMGKRILKEDVSVGADITYWTDVLRLASFQVVQQQYIPDLIDTGSAYAAIWRPIFSNDIIKRLSNLAERMPTVARALTMSNTDMPNGNPHTILQKMTTSMVDYIVRTAASSYNAPKNNLRKRFSSAHDLWLYALKTLGSSRPQLDDMSNLATRIRKWRHPIDIQAESKFRLCFRLEEPQEYSADSQWRISYLLQHKYDPSLMVAADSIWVNDTVQAFESDGYNIREYLVLSLGQAAKISEGIRQGLEQNDIQGYTTDTEGAYKFLSEDAVALQNAGFVVLLPTWWNHKGLKPHITGRAGKKFSSSPGMLSLNTIVSFDWEAALGEQKMTLQELEDLARMKEPLVQVRGKWMAVNTSEIKSAVNFLKKGPKEVAFRDVIKTALGMGDMPQELEFDGVQTDGYMTNILQKINGQVGFEELKQPKDFSGTLRPYQIRGYSWLAFLSQWGLGGCLADDMGLGKTVQMLALIRRDWPKSQRPTLLICPTSVMNNWQREAANFTPDLPVMIHHGMDRLKSQKFKDVAEQHAMVITSYGLIQRDLNFLADVAWRGTVLDEAQNIKNPETKQSRAARSLTADYRFALTGTPVENHLGDLWSIMDFLNPGFLGTQGEFRRNYMTPVQKNQDNNAAERLKRATGPFILRRVKTDKNIISDLPEKMEMKVLCPLTKEQASLYASILKNTESSLMSSVGIQRKGLILSTLTRLKQVCNHPAHFLGDNSHMGDRSGKISRLTEMLEEVISVGERALVFTQYAKMGTMLQNHLKKTFNVDVPFLYGAVPKGKRDIMVDNFQGDNGPPIFILSLKAGGTGLNLTAANHVFHFDRWWNPAVENQATDRVFRIGQEKNVQVHKMICAGTLEEKIDDMIESKKMVADKVVGTGEGWLTEMSNSDLREVLSLSREAAVI